jgi:hypothetical protein
MTLAEAIQACEDSMFIKAADGHAQKRLDAEKTHQIELLADQAKVTKKPMRAETDKNRKRELRVDLAKATRRTGILRMLIVRVDTTDTEQASVAAAAGVDTDDAEQAPVVAAAGVDTDDAEQALVVAPAGVGTEARQTLVVAAPDRIENLFYKELVRLDLRVGQPLSVESTGNDERIIHFDRRGGLDWSEAMVRRSNGLPQPVSGPAAAIFQHFIKIQYRDVRSSVIQKVLSDYVESGGTLVTTPESERAATGHAELAYWLHCAETRKLSIRVWDVGVDGYQYVSVHCPQGTCFHSDAFGYIGAILFLSDGAKVSVVKEIEATANYNRDAQKEVQAMIKLFADTPGLLVTDWPFAEVQVPKNEMDCPGQG